MRLSTELESLKLNSKKKSRTIDWVGGLSLDDPFKRRRELQRKFGKVFTCQCPLCLYQGNADTNRDTVEVTSNLLPICYYEMNIQNYSEAEKLLRRVINQADREDGVARHELGEAYHALGAVLMTQGRWQESHLVWLQGVAVASGHKRLQETVSKLKAYSLEPSLWRSKVVDVLSCHVFDAVDDRIIKNEGKVSVLVSKTSAVDAKTCDWLISSAESLALRSG